MWPPSLEKSVAFEKVTALPVSISIGIFLLSTVTESLLSCGVGVRLILHSACRL